MHFERAQLDLIERLMALEPPVHLFGGFAEDAVLFGKVSRPHADVDVLVWLDELPLRLDQAQSLGFGPFETRFEPAPGRPLAVGAVSGGVDLELCVGQRSIDDRGFFEIPGESGLQRVWLPPDALSHPPQVLEGIVVRTISPLALHQVRAAVTPVFGGLRPKDEVAQQQLHAKFLKEIPAADLVPSIEAVP
jgi:hypothetical protein